MSVGEKKHEKWKAILKPITDICIDCLTNIYKLDNNGDNKIIEFLSLMHTCYSKNKRSIYL